MIRKLMASSAIMALITAGAVSVGQAQTEPAETQDPAVIEQEATVEQDAASAGQDAEAVATDETKLTPEQPTLASAFMGRNVYSSEDPESDNIGEVNDLIIDANGDITHAVIGVGGFLGIGQKDVAVPFEELQVFERDGEIRLVYASTRESLEAAQEFDRAAYDPGARFAEEQAAMQPDATGMGASPGVAPAPADDMAATDLAPAEESEAAGANVEAPDTEETTAEVDMEAAPAEEEMATADATAETTAEADATAATAEEDMAAAGAEMDATAETGAESGFLSYSADQVRATTLIGKEVFGPDGESIGEISDLVLQEDGETRAAIIDVGGFLGVGEKEVAIRFDEIEIRPAEDGGEPQLLVAMSREDLEQMAAFEDRTMGSEEVAADMEAAEETDVAAETDAAPAEEQATADIETDVTTEDQAAVDMETDATTEDQAAVDMEASEQADIAAGTDADVTTEPTAEGFELATQALSAEELIGSAVYGVDDQNIGEVGDVLFDQTGEIEAVVIDVGGFLGLGAKPVAVQFDSLNVQKDVDGDLTLMVNATEEQLEAAPSFDETAAVQQPAQ